MQILEQNDLRLARLFATAAAILQIYGLAMTYVTRSGLQVLASPTVPRILLLIGLALIINAVGLWLSNRLSLLISLLSLIGTGILYLIWYLLSYSEIKMQTENPFYKQYPEASTRQLFGFIEAEWWSFVVFIIVMILLTWEIRTLTILYRFTPKDKPAGLKKWG